MIKYNWSCTQIYMNLVSLKAILVHGVHSVCLLICFCWGFSTPTSRERLFIVIVLSHHVECLRTEGVGCCTDPVKPSERKSKKKYLTWLYWCLVSAVCVCPCLTCPSGLAYCRHLSTVRTHLSALVNHNIVPPDRPCEAAGGLSKEVWSKYQKDCKVGTD